MAPGACSICQKLVAYDRAFVQAETTRNAIKIAGQNCSACDMIYRAFGCHPLLQGIGLDERILLLGSWTTEMQSSHQHQIKRRLTISLGQRHEADIEFYTTDSEPLGQYERFTRELDSLTIMKNELRRAGH